MCDSIMVNDALHFEQIAAKLDFSVEELRDLNLSTGPTLFLPVLENRTL